MIFIGIYGNVITGMIRHFPFGTELLNFKGLDLKKTVLAQKQFQFLFRGILSLKYILDLII